MNRPIQISAILCASVIVFASLGNSFASQAYAATCVGPGPQICADFVGGGDPLFPDHFDVDFTDPDNPDVVLKSGSLVWRVWSKVGEDDPSPANIGAITLNPAVDGDDFDVQILNQGGNGPGAVNVGSIVLDGAANPSWVGFSSIASGSLISGDLNGALTVVKDSTSDGGEVEFEIEGNAQGIITIPLVSSLVIGGNASGALRIGEIIGTNHLVACLAPRDGCLLIEGNLSADLDISGGMEGANLRVLGSVASTATIHIADFTGVPTTGSFVELNVNEAGDFAGDLVLDNGIPDGALVFIFGDSPSSASIDLAGKDMAGQLRLGDNSSVSILDGGVLSSTVQLSHGTGNAYSGSASFDSVSADGAISTASGAQFNGTFTVAGAMAGVFLVANSSDGDIIILGDLSSTIEIQGKLGGDIKIGSDVTSGGGGVTVSGSLESTGRILIDGLCDGAIAIHAETVALSQIVLTGGLGVNGTVEVNKDQGNWNANGTIHVGPVTYFGPPPPPITFVGCIHIYDNDQVPPNNLGGGLKGAIKVVGCHSSPQDNLNICIDGDDNGNVTIEQTNCSNLVGWSCAGCP